jgi:predicted component of type VI protein secretion system
VSFRDKLAGGVQDSTVTSVARNLEAVLNAKKGYSAVVEVYGLGDHEVHFATKPLVDALVAEMTEAVRRFEPRLARPAVRLIGKDRSLWVELELVGEIAGKRVGFAVLLHSVLRNVRVELLRDEAIPP